MQQPRLRIEYVPTDTLAPYANNAKEHGEDDVESIAASIDQFMFNDPIGVWTNPEGVTEIVEGHGRVMAAKRLGIGELPIIRLDHLTDEQRRAYAHVHNQTTMNTGFDFDVLERELAELDFDWEDFGFDFDEQGSWFDTRERNSSKNQDGNDEYNAFTEKFEPKLTTDDCYTPDVVYDAVAEWVADEYGIDRSKFVRPFYPGGDYEAEEYPEGCAVVDNPPFSLLAQIVRFYLGRKIPFFLFAPTLTLFSGRGLDVCYIAADCDITYENGAKVSTSFITNLDNENMVRTAPLLCEAVKEADKANRDGLAKPVNLRYKYPPHVITAAMVAGWCSLGVDFRVPKGHACQIGALDAQREHGKAIYGSGFLLSDAAKAEADKAKAEADKAKALDAAKALGGGLLIEKDGSIVWPLSKRELAIVQSLG